MCLISAVSAFAHTLLLTLVPEVVICSMAIYLPRVNHSFFDRSTLPFPLRTWSSLSLFGGGLVEPTLTPVWHII